MTQNLAKQTLLDEFVRMATSPLASHRPVVECADESLTYAQLHSIASTISAELQAIYGSGRIFAVASENHPYIFAVFIAVWLLGGVVAPIDYHAPDVLVRGMLQVIEPACLIAPFSNHVAISAATDLGIPTHTFTPAESSLSALLLRFGSTSPPSPAQLPSGDADALFVFTSSASSATALKCVPLTHAILYARGTAQLAWLRSEFPADSFHMLRVLGWSPWSHAIGLAHDLGASCILTGGCYVFGIVPSTYQAPAAYVSPAPLGGHIVGRLLATAAARATHAFTAVPWVIRQFMEAERALRDPQHGAQHASLVRTLRGFAVIGAGGAQTDDEVLRWAEELGIQLVLVMGMTEFGGPLFHSRASGPNKPGWPMSSLLIPDAVLTLVDESGVICDEGELWIRSRLIARGYRRSDATAFSASDDGSITFRTGDIWAHRDGRFVWLGRRDDYIQLLSGETLDPRVPERALNADTGIARACLVGDHFLSGASEAICAIIEPSPGAGLLARGDISAAVAAVNRTLPPPLRVPLSRVLVLGPGEQIPVTKKGEVWRKALEEHFGERVKALLESDLPVDAQRKGRNWPKTDIEDTVTRTVASALRLSPAHMKQQFDSTFAELGLDSQIAVKIVNELNEAFGLQLPLNTCHDHVDLSRLVAVVSAQLSPSDPRDVVPSSTSAPPASQSASDDAVVIVGQAFRLPGEINTAEAFWDALRRRRTDLLGPTPPDRWDHASFFDRHRTGQAGLINFEKSGFIDVASFDSAFFGIGAAEAHYVSPSTRLVLETCVEALEDANMSLAAVKDTDLGVFVAVGPDDGYKQLLWADGNDFSSYSRHYGSGVAASTASGRLSYFLDVHGPSIVVDTACSGGMVALDQAVKHIMSGDGETAIVCAVNTHIWPGMFSFVSANQMASPSGRCATFTDEADGYAPSEGCVSFILKRRSAALRDNDNILGVIRSTAVQHNGRSQGLVAPNAQAQSSLQNKLIAKAGLCPSDIDLVEAHGTGTILGDMLEMQAINQVFVGSHPKNRPLVVGASKTVFGHTESAAGLVGVAASLLSIRDGISPGLAHLTAQNLNPNIDTSLCPLDIPRSEVKLFRRMSGTDTPMPRRALTLAYGFAGTISGVILEEPVDLGPATLTNGVQPDNRSALLFVLSAKTSKALLQYMQSYITFCAECRESDLPNICYTSCVGREHHRYRFACVVRTLSDLISRLRDAISTTPKPVNARPRLVFAFPGQGSQYQGMAGALCRSNRAFDEILRETAAKASHLLGLDILPFLVDAPASPGRESIDQTHIAQTAILVYQHAMVRWLHSLRVEPHGVLPHSFGEIAAAVTARCLSLSTGLAFTVLRSSLMRPYPGAEGAMAAIAASSGTISETIHALGLDNAVSIAAFNTARRHVISGDASAVDQVIALLTSNGVRCTRLTVNQGFHSHRMDSIMPHIREWIEHRAHEIHSPKLDYYSSVTGGILTVSDRLGGQYWASQARQPVQFAQAAKKAILDKASLFVDIGPQPMLTVLLREGLDDNDAIASVSAKAGQDADLAFLSALGTMFAHGITPDFGALYRGRIGSFRKRSIPKYPWQRQRHYPSVIPSRSAPPTRPTNPKPSTPEWDVDDALLEALRDHSSGLWPILPAAGLALFVAQSFREDGHGLQCVDMRIHQPLVFNGTKITKKLLLESSGSEPQKFSVSALQDATSTEICTGTVSKAEAPVSIGGVHGTAPELIRTRTEIYSTLNLGRVTFGPSFQGLAELRQWDDRAEGIIEVTSCGDIKHDMIRKLDACFHMFGAIDFIDPSGTKIRLGDGAFLPSSIIA